MNMIEGENMAFLQEFGLLEEAPQSCCMCDKFFFMLLSLIY
jgi:hypothetical protein